MERRQLEYFVAIADHGGYIRAAEQLHVAQPSLSRAIGNLERELGVVLFHRVGRHAVLSSAGEVLLADARVILRHFQTMTATARSLNDGVVGRVAVAVTPSSALEPVASSVAQLRARYPGIVVATSSAGSAADVIDMVLKGHCEVGICARRTRPAMHNLVPYHLRDEEILLVLPPDTDLAATPTVAHESLRGRSFVVTKPDTAVRALFDRLSASVGDMSIAAEVGDRNAILPLVLRGVGAALMPDGWAELAHAAGTSVHPLSPSERMPQWLLHREGRLTPAAEAFIEVTLGSSPR